MTRSSPPIKGLKRVLHMEAIKFIDVGWKPNIVHNKYLREAMSKEYSRRLRLEISTYPKTRVKRYTKKRHLLDLSWQQLEKIVESLKKRRKPKRRRRRTRKRIK